MKRIEHQTIEDIEPHTSGSDIVKVLAIGSESKVKGQPNRQPRQPKEITVKEI